jgi:hypothetical protein
MQRPVAMKIIREVLSLTAIAGFLAGCAGLVVTTPAYIDSGYDPSMLAYAVKEGPVYTEFVGQPYADGDDGFASIVTESLREAQITGRRMEFVADPALASQRSPYRVVVLFNPAPGANSQRICENSAQPMTEPTPSLVRTMVAFCNGSDPLASITGHAPADSPRAPQFASLFHQVALEIFSTRSIQGRGDGGGDFDLN